MDWKECYSSGIVKDVKPDRNLISSLVKSSRNRLESERRLEMSDVTAASKLSLAYDSLREILEALALESGYKIYNHECYTAFLKEIVKESGRGDEFDRLRRVRNSVNYYGRSVSTGEARSIISEIKNLISFVHRLMDK